MSLTDIDQNGKVDVGVIGDSFVFGVGDMANGGSGGYVSRLKNVLERNSGCEVRDYGVPGLTTNELLIRLENIIFYPALQEIVLGSDYLFIHIGANDYYDHGSLVQTENNFREIVSKISDYIYEETAKPIPLISFVSLSPTTRQQNNFISRINDFLYGSMFPFATPIVTFDSLDIALLSGDGLHPTSAGYDRLAELFIESLESLSHSKPYLDSDSDRRIDLQDVCPQGNDFHDQDGDAVPDSCDLCPHDSKKNMPGSCGCGVVDTDTDRDFVPDCRDECPADSEKIIQGQCGCGISDVDIDSDGTPDCLDLCPSNPSKQSPGICGCDFLDADTDEDGIPGCIDECPFDTMKVAPGICGCNSPDRDLNSNGIMDCFFQADIIFETNLLRRKLRKGRRRFSAKNASLHRGRIASLYSQYENIVFANLTDKKILFLANQVLVTLSALENSGQKRQKHLRRLKKKLRHIRRSFPMRSHSAESRDVSP